MIYNFTKEKIIATNYKVCKNLFSQIRGEMFRKQIVPLVFEFNKEQKTGLHSWFVKEPFDVIFLNNSWEVVELVHEFLPKTHYKPKEKAMYILEMPAGTIAQADIDIGDVIHIKKQKNK